MGQFRITAPDGKTYNVTAPEGATQEQILSYVQSQTQGDPRTGFAKPEQPTLREKAGRGMMDVAQGVKQAGLYLGEKMGIVDPGATAAYTKEKTDEAALYEQGRGKDAGIDWGRIAGNIVATLPVAAIPGGAATSMGARVASGAAQGAAASGAMLTEEGGSKVGQVALGTAAGGATPVVLNSIKNALSSMFTKFTAGRGPIDQQLRGQITAELRAQGVDTQQLTREVMDSLVEDARHALRIGGKLDPAMLARKADIEAVGATPFRAAVTRNPRDWQQVKNLRGVEGPGDAIVAVEQRNAEALTTRLAQGGGAGTRSEVGQKVLDAVSKKWAETGDDVSAAYQLARASFGSGSDLPRDRFAGAAMKVLDDFEDVIPAPIQRRLSEFGIDRMGVGQAKKAFTVQEGDELLKLINARYKTTTPGSPEREALNQLRGALKETVLSVAEGGNESAGAFRGAWQAASQRFKEFEAKPIQSLVRGSVAVENVPNTLMKSSIADLRQVKQTLLSGSPEQIGSGREAWDGLRKNVVDGLLLKATGASSVDDVAGKPFSGVRFGKALDAIEPEKLRVIFTPEEVEGLRQLQRAARYLTEEVPFSDVNYSKTGAMIANLMRRIGMTRVAGDIVSTIRGDLQTQLSGSAAVPVARRALPAAPIEKVIPGAAGAALYPASQ